MPYTRDGTNFYCLNKTRSGGQCHPVPYPLKKSPRNLPFALLMKNNIFVAITPKLKKIL